MITTLKADGFKNLTDREVTVGKRTLLVGRNGAGKSALASIPTVAITGALPGGKQKDMTANLSKQVASVTFATDDGHTITRTFTPTGKTKESFEIDGVRMNSQAADGAIAMLFKGNPQTIDVSGFFALGPSEMRRALIERVCGSKAQQMLDAEEKARDAKKKSAASRLSAQKALNQLAGSLTGRPAGDISALQVEAAAVKAEIKSARDIVSEADRKAGIREAASKLHGKEDAIRVEIGVLSKDVEVATANVSDAKAALDAITAEPMLGADEDISKALADVVAKNTELSEKSSSGLVRMVVEDTEGASGILTVLASAYAAMRVLEPFADRYPEVSKSLAAISAMLPSGVVDADTACEWRRTLDASAAERVRLEEECYASAMRNAALRDKKIGEATKVLEANKSLLNEIVRKMQSASSKLSAIEEASVVNGAADSTDAENNARITLTTAEAKLEDINKRMNDLAKWTAIEGEVTKARTAFETATAKAEADDKALDCAIAEIEKAINVAALRIRNSCAEVLGGVVDVRSEDGKVSFVYIKPATYAVGPTSVPREGLSGGEKVMFDAAVGHALAPSAMVLVEAAEVDDDNLNAAMALLSNCDFQVMVCTCHPPDAVPDCWTIITL